MLTGARLLAFVDDIALFEVSYDETLKLKDYTFTLLTKLGLKIHLTKGHFDPILIGEHLGMIIDMQVGQFSASTAKLKQIAFLAKNLLCRAATHKRWVSVKTPASLAGKAQFSHLAIIVAMFFSCESYATSSHLRSVDQGPYALPRSSSGISSGGHTSQTARAAPRYGNQSKTQIYTAIRAATDGERC